MNGNKLIWWLLGAGLAALLAANSTIGVLNMRADDARDKRIDGIERRGETQDEKLDVIVAQYGQITAIQQQTTRIEKDVDILEVLVRQLLQR